MTDHNATADYFEGLAAKTPRRDPERKARLLAVAADYRMRAALQRQLTPRIVDKAIGETTGHVSQET